MPREVTRSEGERVVERQLYNSLCIFQGPRVLWLLSHSYLKVYYDLYSGHYEI